MSLSSLGYAQTCNSYTVVHFMRNIQLSIWEIGPTCRRRPDVLEYMTPDEIMATFTCFGITLFFISPYAHYLQNTIHAYINTSVYKYIYTSKHVLHGICSSHIYSELTNLCSMYRKKGVFL